MMTDRDGKKFRCNLPLPESTHDVKEEQQNGSSIGLTADDRSTRKTPEDLLEALKEKCFRRVHLFYPYHFNCSRDYHAIFLDTQVLWIVVDLQDDRV